jgi:hypothetical protein
MDLAAHAPHDGMEPEAARQSRSEGAIERKSGLICSCELPRDRIDSVMRSMTYFPGETVSQMSFRSVVRSFSS